MREYIFAKINQISVKYRTVSMFILYFKSDPSVRIRIINIYLMGSNSAQTFYLFLNGPHINFLTVVRTSIVA